LEFREILEKYRPIDGTAQRAPDKRGARCAQARDGVLRGSLFLCLEPKAARRHQLLPSMSDFDEL
jgi:hypothetical protein